MFDAEKHKHMIRSPGKWPRYPLLPLKHRMRKFTDPDSLGFLIAMPMPPYRVYIGWMFVQTLDGLPVETYADLDALLADWEVD
jgi:hypothetical protein